MVEEYVFVAGLHRVAEKVFAPGVAKGDELTVPFHALGADGADVVITDALESKRLSAGSSVETSLEVMGAGDGD